MCDFIKEMIKEEVLDTLIHKVEYACFMMLKPVYDPAHE
jgi:hypothetical protein